MDSPRASGDSGPLDSPPRDSAQQLLSAHRVELPEGSSWTGPLQVGWIHADFGAGPALGPSLAHETLEEAGSFTLPLPEAPPGELLGSLGNAVPEASGAIWVLIAWEDLDGDGAFTAGEPARGIDLDALLLWGEGEGVPAGWSLQDLGMAGLYEPNRCLSDSSEPLGWREGYPQARALGEEQTILLRGLEVRTTFAWTEASDALPADSLALMPYQALSGEGYTPASVTPLDDGALTPELAPPEDHLANGHPEWGYTWHLLLPFLDADGDGAWSAEEGWTGDSSCDDEGLVLARWTRPVDSWTGLRLLDCYGGSVGWRAARVDPDSGAPVHLDATEAGSLTLGGADCRLD